MAARKCTRTQRGPRVWMVRCEHLPVCSWSLTITYVRLLPAAMACTTGPNNAACQNSGTITGDLVAGCTCTCATGYEGDNCQTETPCTDVQITCANGGARTGTIVAGNCACDCTEAKQVTGEDSARDVQVYDGGTCSDGAWLY
jgi:hypothetical protein